MEKNLTMIEEDEMDADSLAEQSQTSPIYAPWQLAEKVIEPEKGRQKLVNNKDFQLGFIKPDQFDTYKVIFRVANMFNGCPYEYGGWLSATYSGQLVDLSNDEFIASTSIGGFGRRSVTQESKVTKFIGVDKTKKNTR